MTPDHAESVDHVIARSAALREAATGHLDAPVPACPGWRVADLVTHLGDVQRFWAAAVRAGPADTRPDVDIPDAPAGDALLAWAEESTADLVAALRATGPDAGAYTWWGEPRRVSAIARHQVHEAAVHAFDAQEAAGVPAPVPREVALDGIDEFLAIVDRCPDAWPHPPATVALEADGAEAGWVVRLVPEGGTVRRAVPEGDAVLRGDPGDLVLALYRRRGPEVLRVDGDRELAQRFLAWSDLS